MRNRNATKSYVKDHIAMAVEFAKVQEQFLRQMHRCFPDCPAVAQMLKTVRKEKKQRLELWKREVVPHYQSGSVEFIDEIPHMRSMQLGQKLECLNSQSSQGFWWYIDMMTAVARAEHPPQQHFRTGGRDRRMPFECYDDRGEITAKLHYGRNVVSSRRLRTPACRNTQHMNEFVARLLR